MTVQQMAEGVYLIRAASPSEVAGADTESRCAKCTQHFNPADTRFDGAAQHAGTPFCRECVDRCQDTEIADHWCPVDQWRTDRRGAVDAD